ncbi:MAG: aminotransferase class V-fold PLP-dependent enzyme [Actinomycetota bacterium]
MTTLPAAYLEQFAEPPGYLEFASTGPVSRRVREAMAAPRGTAWDAIAALHETALAAMARLVAVPADRVAPLPSTSAGLFQVAFGLLGSGGNVVLPAHEFPANVYPWLRAEGAGGPEVRLVPCPDRRVTAVRLAPAVDSQTRAVAVSLVDFVTGFRVDLAELRRAFPAPLLAVDAIQGLGAVAAVLGPADVLVAGGQKWLRAGWGSGVMAVSDRALERLAPTLTGWCGVEAFLDFETPPPHDARETASRFQEGSPPYLGTLQMGAAVEVIEMAGIAAIEAAVLARAAAVEEVVRRAGAEVLAPWRRPEERAGIVSFHLPGEDPAATAARLAAAGLVVSRRSGWVRVSPHASTPAEAVGRLREALDG